MWYEDEEWNKRPNIRNMSMFCLFKCNILLFRVLLVILKISVLWNLCGKCDFDDIKVTKKQSFALSLNSIFFEIFAGLGMDFFKFELWTLILVFAELAIFYSI